MILRGFKGRAIGTLQCITPFCVSKFFWFLFLSPSLALWRKGLKSCHAHTQAAVTSSLCPPIRSGRQSQAPAPQVRRMAPGLRCGQRAVASIQNSSSLLFANSFFLSNLLFVAILALHHEHKKLLAGFSSPSCRGICNWRQLTPFWSPLYSCSFNCKYHPSHTQGSSHLIIALGPGGVCICG